jgi:hypothetical protein
LWLNRLATLAAWALLAATLAACSAAQIADGVPAWAGGEPSGTPARRAVPLAYPNLNQAPRQPEAKPLTAEEQARLRTDLAATGQRQTARAQAIEREREERGATAPAAGDKPE